MKPFELVPGEQGFNFLAVSYYEDEPETQTLTVELTSGREVILTDNERLVFLQLADYASKYFQLEFLDVMKNVEDSNQRLVQMQNTAVQNAAPPPQRGQ